MILCIAFLLVLFLFYWFWHWVWNPSISDSVMNCSITTNLWTSYCFYCCCFPALWWSLKTQGIISIFLNLLRLVLCSSTWSISEKVLCTPEKKVCSFVFFCKVFCKYLLEPFGLWHQLASAFMFSFYLTNLSTWQE